MLQNRYALTSDTANRLTVRVFKDEEEFLKPTNDSRTRQNGDSDHLDVLGEILPANPVLTLKEMIRASVDRECPQTSPSTRVTYLETMLISWKAVTYCLQQRNTPENKDMRYNQR
jgi:hypothetical protein